MNERGRPEITALKVHQWLKDWDEVPFDPASRRRRPGEYLYMFTLPAAKLRALSGIYRRTTANDLQRNQDLGIQRRHDSARSSEIQAYIQFGYPWSTLRRSAQPSTNVRDLRKPGWLPTAIVVNILVPEDTRGGRKVANQDVITMGASVGGVATLRLPQHFDLPEWGPSELPPIEVIDGQHRLWAFDEDFTDDFELPIVAFHGLDISWQAYLFWTINIKPVRINPSLAFDLYPLLRTESWLDKAEGHAIYRETRAQELTSALWGHKESPWYRRINMLGEPGAGGTSQASWIRALVATYVKSWENKRSSIGGLFGAPSDEYGEVLPWSGAQQAAFLIYAWRKMRDAVSELDTNWTARLRQPLSYRYGASFDPAFEGKQTLLNTEQGIRGILYITNDLCFVRAREYKFRVWVDHQDAGATDESAVTEALKSLEQHSAAGYLMIIAQGLAQYDWRTAAADLSDLSELERTSKLALRGSGGYKLLRQQLLNSLIAQDLPSVSKAAAEVKALLGYE